MKTALDIAKLLAYCALIVLLGECAFAVHRLRPQAEATMTDVRRTVVIVAGAATNFEKASRVWESSSKEQSQSTTRAMSNVNVAAERASKLLVDLDGQLSSLLLTANRSVGEQNASLLETQAKLRESLVAMNQATTQLQATLADAGAILSSPELQKSLASLAESSQHTSEATAHLAATTKDVQQVADAFRSDYLKPKNRALAYLKAILGLGSQGRILFNK